MTGKSPSSLSPRLRFPEFQRDPAWRRESMRRYLQESRKKGSTGEEAKKLTVKLWGKGVVEKQEAVKGSSSTQYYRRSAGQFIYSKLDFLNQAFGIIPDSLDGFESTVDLPCFDVDPDLVAKFLLEYVQRGEFYKIRGEIADGGRKAKRIQVDTFLDCPIYAPSKLEQQKIADCLGSLDDLIAAEGRKLEALRRHKQGLMQQLFPQPGETVPRLRFPEFRSEPAWTAKQLGDLDPFVTSGSRGWARHYSDSGDLFIRITNLTRESIYLDLTDSKYVDLPSMTSESERTRIQKHDILISVTADIGIVGFVGEAVPIPAYINQHIALVRCDEEQVCSEYVAAYLASDVAQRRFSESADQGAKAGMNLDEVRRIRLILPHREEQYQIASCLRSVQAQLDMQCDWLRALRVHKTAMLQQLFPSLAELEQ